MQTRCPSKPWEHTRGTLYISWMKFGFRFPSSKIAGGRWDYQGKNGCQIQSGIAAPDRDRIGGSKCATVHLTDHAFVFIQAPTVYLFSTNIDKFLRPIPANGIWAHGKEGGERMHLDNAPPSLAHISMHPSLQICAIMAIYRATHIAVISRWPSPPLPSL